MSALGDIIHTLPSIADIYTKWPESIIDIAVDERFVGLAKQNKYINKVIGIPLKKSKNAILNTKTWKSLAHAIISLREQEYDLVIDLHGLIKSAVVSRLARTNQRVGFHASHCSEHGAALFYQRHFLTDQHSPNRVHWLRSLTAFALDSEVPTYLDYGIPLITQEKSTQPLKIIFFHSVSREDRLWAESNWIALGNQLIEAGYEIELPWGTPEEKERAYRLQNSIGTKHSTISPLRSIEEWVHHFSSVFMAIGLDTGLTHLAAATGVPCLAIFTTTGPNLLIAQKPEFACAIGGNGYIPTIEEVRNASKLLIRYVNKT